MVMSEVLAALRERGLKVQEWHVRFAIKSGKVSRPTIDGSHRFVFGKSDVDKIEKAIKENRRNRNHRPVSQ